MFVPLVRAKAAKPVKAVLRSKLKTWTREKRPSQAMGAAMAHLQRRRLRPIWCLLVGLEGLALAPTSGTGAGLAT